jgi:DNA polymerase
MSASEFLPRSRTLSALRTAAPMCQGCDLYLHATRTVFGEGPQDAKVILVGEQPGDQEDRAARPFVGPAGRILDESLEEAGIRRDEVYVTNAVKHFKFTMQGKRRLHKKPGARELAACRPWLEAELEAIHPLAIVCMGATAAQSLLGREFRITQQRGEFIESHWASLVMATYHPSAILRAPEKEQRDRLRADFVSDLRKLAERLAAVTASR